MASNTSGQDIASPAPQAMHMNPEIENDRQMILDAKAKGRWPLFRTFVKLSGPGWLQSGITLGGGSLSSSLYLGVLVGFSFMWLQPLAMILGIIMLVSAAVFLFGRYLAAAFRVLQCAVREIVEAGDVPGCADQFDPGG